MTRTETSLSLSRDVTEPDVTVKLRRADLTGNILRRG